MAQAGYIRIGELARRSGVSPELLRAWERRYALLSPDRTAGGFRLYSDDDLARVTAMKRHLDAGLSAAQAARLARDSAPGDGAGAGEAPLFGTAFEDLERALAAFDEDGAHAALDRLLASFAVETVLADAVLPLLRGLGEGWSLGETTVAQEHFASQLVRGRLLGLARGWGRGTGPRALLATPAGELHDLGLVVHGLALRERGWRVTFLGADTPVETILDTARRVAPQLVVLSAHAPEPCERAEDELRALAALWPVALAGPGATRALADAVSARHLAEGPLEAAEQVTGSLAAAR